MYTRAERRKIDFSKAIRKKKIVNSHGYDWYDNIHQYSKNKVHCSCNLCRRRKTWSSGKNSIANESIADQKKYNDIQEQLDENNYEELGE